ncbi:endospore coat-associated protein YheD [Oxobacter pfennigii]|uniref:Endospore coat-associated protein YheD n=1 Tax=Oxobacter pfennigii TaxID=36849 RepID=A0A0P9AEQ2_9CLOT|nr:YheC/YheD family protein [Oxobacter pfennigii]KPU43799.1 endospore coat-associated protein YheD [Oxobacter pfennigii]
MWVNIEIISGNNREISLPIPLAEKLNDDVTVSFGLIDVAAKVYGAIDLTMRGGVEFEEPLLIKLTSRLARLLNIKNTSVYRMKYDKYNIILGPSIGLLLGNKNYMYSPEHMVKYTDRFGIYNKIGGFICAFSPESIDWEELVAYGLYYNYNKRDWQYGRFPIPSSIYRRDFHSHPHDIERLITATGGKLFNSWRFTKYNLYNYLKKHEELSKKLPATESTKDYETVKKFINKYGKVILKPVSLSRGRGICIIRKENDVYNIFDYRSKDPVKLILDERLLRGFFRYNSMFFERYIMQELLSLAKVDGGLFDIRVVMQKDSSAKWKCSGIECRVAGKDSLITNISRGGYAMHLDEAFIKAFPESNYEELKQSLNDLCYKLCIYMDETRHHFAEFGIDIAIDEDKRFWIIEVNVFPSFKGFKDMDYETYLDIRYTPLYYAAWLSGFDLDSGGGGNDAI